MPVYLGAIKSAREKKTKDYIKNIYSNLTEKKGVITTESQWFDKNGVKRLQYGFDPYTDGDDFNILKFYSWDFNDSGLGYYDFQEKLKDFFEKKYNKKVNKMQSLYTGWKRKEKGTY